MYKNNYIPRPRGIYPRYAKLIQHLKITVVPFFFLKIALAIRGFLYFHTNLEIICSSSVKNMAGSLIGIALNL